MSNDGRFNEQEPDLTFAYDSAGRLKSVARNAMPIAAYQCDLSGNRVRTSESSDVTLATFDARDQLLTNGIASYAYNDAGSVASKTVGGSVTKYGYDAWQQLKDDFLGFPVGMKVPLGVLDPAGTTWVPQPDGRVIKVLSVSGGAATIDANGDGAPDPQSVLDSLGLTSTELQQLAATYTPGATLMRTRLFGLYPFDANLPFKAHGGSPSDGRH